MNAARAGIVLVLGCTLLGALTVELTAHGTAGVVRRSEAQARWQALRPTVTVDYDNEPPDDWIEVEDPGAGARHGSVRVYRARAAGRVVAVALSVTAPDGYGGPIRLAVGIAADGRILGVRPLAHTETPGVGARIDPGASRWLAGFAGRSLGNTPAEAWAVGRGQFDAVGGATITSAAVVRAVHRALQRFDADRARLLDAAPPAP
ncbi:MAG: RnfABCDGE type electron transport complex subunit G [Gammaproteobacteria bacterium]|nr:RnfABCDGE type electron transport complex subunit G [Gammaproteobacteria bacterium]